MGKDILAKVKMICEIKYICKILQVFFSEEKG